MERKERMEGISFIEVVIAFAITCVLVAAAMPNFHDYAIRAKVVDGLDITQAAQDALVRTCMADETARVKQNRDAGYHFNPMANQKDFVEKVVLAADCAEKALIVVLWTENTGASQDPIIELTARVPSGVTAEGFEKPYDWHCRIIRGDFAHVPSNCRKRYRKS